MTKVKNRGIFAIVLLALAMALTACGARIDSVVTLETDQSGTRVITVNVNPDDVEKYLAGDASAIDSLFVENTPEELTYDGVSTAEDGSTVFTFTLAFADNEEYQDKVTRLLALDGNRDPVEIEYNVLDSVFTKGVVYRENFTDVQLMGWALALVEELGIVTDSHDETVTRDNLAEKGTARLVAGTIESEGGLYSHSVEEVDDLRVRELIVETSGIETGDYVRTITYDLPREFYVADEEGFDNFFESVTPEGGELTRPSPTGTEWSISFSSDDPAEIAKWTDAALLASDSEFAVTHGISTEEGRLGHELEIVDYFDCSQVCQGDGAESNIGKITYDLDEAWAANDSYRPSREAHKFLKPIEATSADVRLEASLENASLELEYLFEPVADEGLVEAVKAELQNSFPDAEVSSDESDEALTIKAVISAENLETMNTVLNNKLNSHILVTTASEGLTSETIYTEIILGLPSDLMYGAETSTIALKLPDSGKLETDPSSTTPEIELDGDTYKLLATSGQYFVLTGTGEQTKLSGYLIILLPLLLLVPAVAYFVKRARDGKAAENQGSDFAVPTGFGEMESVPGAAEFHSSVPPADMRYPEGPTDPSPSETTSEELSSPNDSEEESHENL